MKTIRKILKWFALDTSRPDKTEEFIARTKHQMQSGTLIDITGEFKEVGFQPKNVFIDPCYNHEQRPQNPAFPEYDQMEMNLRHAKEWRQSNNPQMELRSLSQLWRILLDRQNIIRKEAEKEQPAVIIPGSTGPNTTEI